MAAIRLTEGIWNNMDPVDWFSTIRKMKYLTNLVILCWYVNIFQVRQKCAYFSDYVDYKI